MSHPCKSKAAPSRKAEDKKLRPSLLTGVSEPLLHPLKEARRIIGVGHSKIYELLGDGTLDGRKINARTAVTHASLLRYLASLPKFVPGSGLPNHRGKVREEAAARSRRSKARQAVQS